MSSTYHQFIEMKNTTAMHNAHNKQLTITVTYYMPRGHQYRHRSTDYQKWNRNIKLE